jgi:hypothetical protein
MSTSHVPQTTAFVGLSLLDGGSFIADTGKLHADVNNVKFGCTIGPFAFPIRMSVFCGTSDLMR